MAFDLATAQASSNFDLTTAKPEQPPTRRAWGDVPGEALTNIPSSAGKFVGGLYEAITSPIQTVKGMWDIGAGALQNITPQGIKDFINRFETNPAAAKQAVNAANAVGGFYKQRYGTEEGFKEALATDPVGVASDFSMLVTGGASVASGYGRIATPLAGRMLNVPPSTVSNALALWDKGIVAPLETVAAYTNPVTPFTKTAEYGLGLAAKGAGNVIDFMQGQRPQVRAGSIIRNALTEEGRTPQNVLAAQLALQNAPPGLTVRQALADVTSPQIQYLGELIQSETAPGAALAVQRAQEAARAARLQAVTPDIQTAQAMRANVAGPLYTAATQPTTAVATAPLVQNIDNILAANPGNTKLVSALNQVKSGLEASTTAEQVSSVLDNLKDLIATKDNKFIVKNLVDVKSTIEQALPGYQRAQQVFAAASPPVNQAKVLGAMQDVLAQPLGVGERAGPFMTAMGRGEQALLKKATGEPRYTELRQVLSPSQMRVVTEVESELLRNAKVAEQTAAGAKAMKTIMEANQSKFRLPDFISVKVTLTNEMLRLMEGRLNAKVMTELEKGFQSGTSFVDLMNKIPASQRIEVLRALGEAQGYLSPAKINVWARSQNALAPESENALAP
jgi:hypothetical protein